MFSDRNQILKCYLAQASQTRGTSARFVRSERPSYSNYKMRPTTQPSISSASTVAGNFIAVKNKIFRGWFFFLNL